MIKNEKNPAFGQKKVRADIFSGSLVIFRNDRNERVAFATWRTLSAGVHQRWTEAESVGFEPTWAFTPACFPSKYHRPLGELSLLFP